MRPDQQRFVYLDGLRGLAALVITLSHFCDRTLGHALFDRIYLAVDFFFILGGFVSCYAYERRLLTDMSFTDFAKRRLIRLYPLYFLGFLLGLFVTIDLCVHDGTHLSHIVGPALAHVLMLPLPHKAAFNGIAVTTAVYGEAFPLNFVVWALAYEVFVSLLYGVLAPRLSNRRLAAVIAGFFALYSIGAAIAGTYATGSQIVHILPAFCRVGFSFFMGVLVFRLSNTRMRLRWAWIPLTAAFYLLLAIPHQPHNNRLIDVPLLLVALPALVFLSAKADMPKWLDKACRVSGELAYPIYMTHYPVIAVATMLVIHHGLKGWALPAAFAVAFSLILTLSAFALRFWDEPIRRWLNRVSFGARPAKAAPAASRAS